MTIPLYTNLITSRKPNALVYMFVSAIIERSEHISTTNLAGESGVHQVGRGIRNLTLLPMAWLRRADENRLSVYMMGKGFSTSNNHQRADKERD